MKSFERLEESDVIVSHRLSKERAFPINRGHVGHVTITEDTNIGLSQKLRPLNRGVFLWIYVSAVSRRAGELTINFMAQVPADSVDGNGTRITCVLNGSAKDSRESRPAY